MDKVKYWLDLAQYDLESALVMLSGSKYLYVGFMCHQTIEKALKAYYSNICDDVPPYIHNLLRLSELTGLLSQYDKKQRQFIISINPLNIEARYPIQKEKLESLLSKDYCIQLVKETEAFLQWIKNRLSQ